MGISTLCGETLAVTRRRAPGLDKGVLRGAIGLTLITLAGFGFLYTLAGVSLGQALFPAAANGSLIERDGRVVGSALVAQPFSGARYFQPRPSAAGYDMLALAGSNQARTSAAMRARIAAERAAVAQRENVAPAALPSDLVTQSGSGSDPHISPQAAALQIDRVARARGLPAQAVAEQVAGHTEPPQWGLFGAARVNVLALNLALDRMAPARNTR